METTKWLLLGFVEIKEIAHDPHPILAGDVWYTSDGYWSPTKKGMPVLYWDKPEIIAPKQPEQVPPVDMLVEVRTDVPSKWIKRYSAGRLSEEEWHGGKALMVYPFGATSLTFDPEDGLRRYYKWRKAEDAGKC